MNLHTPKPACFTTEEPKDRNAAFRDNARYCYTTPHDARTHTPGCWGCRRSIYDLSQRPAE